MARPVLVASLLAFVLGFLGTPTIAFTDYEVEAEAAARALAAGELGRFAELAPAYGGSLVLRAPFALAAGALGLGGDLALYRALVLPALLAVVVLGLVLFAAAATPRARWLALLLAVGNPLSLRALEVGHPEELVGGVLCVGAALAALRDRALVAGVLLGLAGANKPWAILAALPVLLALERDRVRCALVAGSVCALFLMPLLLAGSVASSLVAAGTEPTAIFQPWQLFWFFGEHAGPVQGLTGEKEGFRTAARWASSISHPVVVLAGLGLALAWWPVRRRDGVLALLALALLSRCLLDTWNTSYYAVPCLLALLAHEVVARRRVPWATFTLTWAFWVCFELLSTPDVQAAAYLLVAGSAWGALALAAFAPARAAALTASLASRAARALPSLAALAREGADGREERPGADGAPVHDGARPVDEHERHVLA